MTLFFSLCVLKEPLALCHTQLNPFNDTAYFFAGYHGKLSSATHFPHVFSTSWTWGLSIPLVATHGTRTVHVLDAVQALQAIHPSPSQPRVAKLHFFLKILLWSYEYKVVSGSSLATLPRAFSPVQFIHSYCLIFPLLFPMLPCGGSGLYLNCNCNFISQI